jgi:hypothetical protein
VELEVTNLYDKRAVGRAAFLVNRDVEVHITISGIFRIDEKLTICREFEVKHGSMGHTFALIIGVYTSYMV